MAIVPRRIPVDPKLWGRIRMLAFSRGSTAASVVGDALRAYLASEADREFDEAFVLPRDPGPGLDAPVPEPFPPVAGLYADTGLFREDDPAQVAEARAVLGRLDGRRAEASVVAKAQELAASKSRPMTPAPKPGSARRG